MFLTFLGIGITAILAAGVVATYVRKDQALIRANVELGKLKGKPSTWDHEMAALRTELATAQLTKETLELQLSRHRESEYHLGQSLLSTYQLVMAEAVRRRIEVPEPLKEPVGASVDPDRLNAISADMNLLAGRLVAMTDDDRERLEKYGQLLDDQIERNVRFVNAATDFLKKLEPVPTEARKQIEFYLREQQLGMMTVVVLFTFRRDKSESYFREQLSKVEDRTLLRDTRHRTEQILNNLSAEHREAYLRLETNS